MNVFNNPNIQRLARIFRTETEAPKPKVKPSEGTEKTSKSDSVNLSPEARVLAAIKQRLQEVPDVRADKVAQLREQIQNGTYRVSAEDIAQAILDEGKLK